jgi:hypothetical protein
MTQLKFLRELKTRIELYVYKLHFQRLNEAFGPKTLETITNEWHNLPYTLTHQDSMHSPWHLRFAGIELPKYDGIYDGPHNNIVRILFTHLLARELDWQYGNAPGDFSGPDSVNSENTSQIPGCEVRSLPEGNRIARKTIESFLTYKPKIDEAIRHIEKIYEINSTTRRSKSLGPSSYVTFVDSKYPHFRDMIPQLREKFGLDYLSDSLH